MKDVEQLQKELDAALESEDDDLVSELQAQIEELEEGTDDGQDKNTDKTFTQQDLNEQVKARLARQRAKFTKDLSASKTLVESLQSQVDEYESLLSNQIQSQIESLPAPVRTLLERLDISEQLEWLSDPENRIKMKTTPKTPNPADDDKTVIKPSDLGRMV